MKLCLWWRTYFAISHLDAVRALAFHPTELCLATGGDDCTVKIWRVDVASLASSMYVMKPCYLWVRPSERLIGTVHARRQRSSHSLPFGATPLPSHASFIHRARGCSTPRHLTPLSGCGPFRHSRTRHTPRMTKRGLAGSSSGTQMLCGIWRLSVMRAPLSAVELRVR